ncbi:MAG: MarR family winged helix-turn-helix transcriptional regulator [Archangium sp.]
MHEPICNCTALRQATRVVTQLYDSQLVEVGLTSSQYSLLSRLSRKGPLSLQALADELVLDRTTLTRNLAPLERDGFVVSAIDPDDNRSRKLALSTKGQKKFEKAKVAWERAQERFHELYGRDEAATLRRALARVITSTQR